MTCQYFFVENLLNENSVLVKYNDGVELLYGYPPERMGFGVSELSESNFYMAIVKGYSYVQFKINLWHFVRRGGKCTNGNIDVCVKNGQEEPQFVSFPVTERETVDLTVNRFILYKARSFYG